MEVSTSTDQKVMPVSTAEAVQANLLRAVKFRGGSTKAPRTRDWSLYFFFRILSDPERALVFNVLPPPAAEAAEDGGLRERLQISAAEGDPDEATAFRKWLNVLVNGDQAALHGLIDDFFDAFGAGRTLGGDLQSIVADFPWSTISNDSSGFKNNFGAHMLAFRDKALGSPHPLPWLALSELMRQSGSAHVPPTDTIRATVRGEHSSLAGEGAGPADLTPANIAFTFTGLKTLNLDEVTLASFPDAFRQGMAARSARLGDTGPSAPEHWEGSLGTPAIHGYFTDTSDLDPGSLLPESFWKRLRADICSFNDPVDAHGEALRTALRLLFAVIGVEILHIELGQDPYTLDEAGKRVPARPRREHFGFRDGLSQPFVDLNLKPLGDPAAGGGTPARRNGWTPVAPGEVFLSEQDENDDQHLLPANAVLRQGSTFLVFRKLEQDVQGWRGFLQRARPGDADAQAKLAAQIIGRWPDGAPLVRSPDINRRFDEPPSKATLNDFRYAAEDPDGRRCPLGAHIRRSNPRDIGGRDQVRRHRILRHGMAYGGRLLAPGQPDDGERRGLLFIVANARIETQFELVQADWLNGGEFLGQAGLGRCPLAGANEGRTSDVFKEAGAIAPIVEMPRFVTTRGGDYFFAPGIPALKGMIASDPFKPDNSLQLGSHGDARTPGLFDAPRIRMLVERSRGAPSQSVTRYGIPGPVPQPADPCDCKDAVAFVGRYDDVLTVLADKAGAPQSFSTCPYRLTARQMTHGNDLLVGTDASGPTAPTHVRLTTILDQAWSQLDTWLAGSGGVTAIVRDRAVERLDKALRSRAGPRTVDLLDDIAAPASYAVLSDVLGLAGPDRLSEMALALPFARQHVGDLPRDWTAALRGEAPAEPARVTTQIWAAMFAADLIGNFANSATLRAASTQAVAEMMILIRTRLAEAQTRLQVGRPKHALTDAFAANENNAAVRALYTQGGSLPVDWLSRYRRDTCFVLLELFGSTMAAIPLTFATSMTLLLASGLDLSPLLRRLEGLPPGKRDAVIASLLYEADRLNPAAPLRARRCEVDTRMSDGRTVREGDYVAALLLAANLDEKFFPEPEKFRLDRDPSLYLTFGTAGGKQCWGRDKVALPVLIECIRAIGRLTGLRRIAGTAGEPQKVSGLTIGLPARFTRLLSRP